MHTGPVIAVVDDFPDLLESITNLLSLFGYFVVTSNVRDLMAGGKYAMALFLSEHDPVVVIFDITPPYAKTLSYLKTFIRQEAARGRKFIITTTTPEVARASASLPGIAQVFIKPPHPTELLSAIKQAVESAT